MDISVKLNGSNWTRQPPADSEEVQRLKDASKIELPADYLELLLYSNGGEGTLGIEPGWFQLWPAQEALNLNTAYGVSENLPGFWGFGSNGGDELLAFDFRNGSPWKVAMVPFIGMDPENAIIIAHSFDAFVGALGREQE